MSGGLYYASYGCQSEKKHITANEPGSDAIALSDSIAIGWKVNKTDTIAGKSDSIGSTEFR